MLTATGSSCAHDQFQFLEEVQGARALSWVDGQNARSQGVLKNDLRYARLENDLRAIYLSPARLPKPWFVGEQLYNFWQDANHVRGIIRRTSMESFKTANPTWELVLDLDALAASERENWVYQSMNCYETERCLLSLSRGGGDAAVIREFDLTTKTFVAGGFEMPESKGSVDWIDRDHVLVSPDLGEASMTTSGYPRQVRVWTRGARFQDAPLVYESQKDDVYAAGATYFRSAGNVSVISRGKTFYSGETLILRNNTTLEKVPVQDDAIFQGVFDGYALVSLRSRWITHGKKFQAGSLLAIPLNNLHAKPELVYEPNARSSLSQVASTNDRLYIFAFENVQGKLLSYRKKQNRWVSEALSLPGAGSIESVSNQGRGTKLVAYYEDFLTPASLLLVDTAASTRVESIKASVHWFDSSRYEVTQNESTSADGTRIPYFMISRKGLILDGKNPTLLYGYGGFEVSMTATYSGGLGKAWLDQGGVYVLANIRGGGEFGPRWHESAILKNRQKAYDDFISVAEDLIQRQVTTPRRLGIKGGSNGGLLVGAVMVQRPELFNAVVCEVPLLDMFRYHLLPAGASWMAEYGNPEDPEMAAVIGRYSPYQNVRAGVNYPKPFFMTSTADDRVHPGHARKMAAKMESFGEDFLFFENREGGHGGAANLEQKVKKDSLSFTYLYQRLVD